VAYHDASALLSSLCAARLAGKANSLVVAGRGGLPYNADAYMPVFALADAGGWPTQGGAAIRGTDKLTTTNARMLAGCGGT
jgi:hypothetical protein